MCSYSIDLAAFYPRVILWLLRRNSTATPYLCSNSVIWYYVVMGIKTLMSDSIQIDYQPHTHYSYEFCLKISNLYYQYSEIQM